MFIWLSRPKTLEYFIFYSWPFLVSWEIAVLTVPTLLWQIVFTLLTGAIGGFFFNDLVTIRLSEFFHDIFSPEGPWQLRKTVLWTLNSLALYLIVISGWLFYSHLNFMAWLLLILNVLVFIPINRIFQYK